MKIGFVGLGAMGRPIAANLAVAGHEVLGWNRSGGAVDGVTTVGDPAEAFRGDVAMTMLSDDAAIRDVILQPGLLGRASAALAHVVWQLAELMPISRLILAIR